MENEIPGMDALRQKIYTALILFGIEELGTKPTIQKTDMILHSGRKISNSQLPDDYEPGCFLIFSTEMYIIVKPKISFILVDLENMAELLLLPQMALFLYKMLLV